MIKIKGPERHSKHYVIKRTIIRAIWTFDVNGFFFFAIAKHLSLCIIEL